MQYAVQTRDVAQGRTVYTLIDHTSGAQASILPGFGMNLFDLQLPVGDQVLPLIVTAEGWVENPTRPGGHGTPVLFPFPNRIGQAQFTFEGKTYQLPANNRNNAIHGFAIDASWMVVEAGTDDQGAFLEGRYRIGESTPDRLRQWPSDGELRLRYQLQGRRLDLMATVTNPTESPLPYGLGFHPYFRLPFQKGSDLARTQVILPAAQYWVLDEMLPTGQRRPVDNRLDFQTGQTMVDLKLDDVLTDIQFDGQGEDARASCRLIDQTLGGEFRLSFDQGFREIVAYTPSGDGGVIAVEPYTQATDAINLHARGIEAGLRILPHDATETFRISMETVG